MGTAKMALRAYGKRLLIEPAKAETKKGSIVIPDGAKTRPLRGKVKNVGSEILDITEGTTVYYSAFAGTEIEVDGERFLVLAQDDVLATDILN